MNCRHVDAPTTPLMLRLAPELGVLSILDEAMSTAVYALLAAHPHLATVATGSTAPDESAARRLHDCLVHASHVLADYRWAVAEIVHDLEDASIPP